MTPDEQRLARSMHFEQRKGPAEIARTLRRSLSSISRLLAQKRAPRPIGRPWALTEAKVDSIVALLERMVTAADGSEEVAMDMRMITAMVMKSLLPSSGARQQILLMKISHWMKKE